MNTNEIDVIKQIDEALSNLDEKTRLRVLRWALDKYRGGEKTDSTSDSFLTIKTSNEGIDTKCQEIPGIAQLTEEGDFILTVRDIKAKSTNDAAIRLVHVVILAYEKLTGENKVSSKEILVPILKEWRAYTGNTRNEIAKHKGILRSGTKIYLDAHSKRDAQRFINEILDVSFKGKWKPR